jgi:hypothetical protein
MAIAGFGACRSPIPDHGDRPFRSIPIADFAPWRSPIPEHGDRPFRSMAIADSGA